MNTYKKIFFKYVLIFLLLIFFVHSTFIIAQQSIRKLIESDRLFLFLMRNTVMNLEKLSNYKPTDEEKKQLKIILEEIKKNWNLNEGP